MPIVAPAPPDCKPKIVAAPIVFAGRRESLLGALGAFLMLVGDLCLSVIPASPGDSGLFAREAYLNGSWDAWRLPLLIAAGLCGMALGAEISTWDFVLSQGSGNAALCLWMLTNAIWAGRQKTAEILA